MPRTIRTPDGDVQAITTEEFDSLVASFSRVSYRVGKDLDPECKKCGGKIKLIRVEHVVLYNERYAPIPTWEEAYDKGDTAGYHRPYCFQCEGQPNPIGPPVIVEGSFYTVH